MPLADVGDDGHVGAKYRWSLDLRDTLDQAQSAGLAKVICGGHVGAAPRAGNERAIHAYHRVRGRGTDAFGGAFLDERVELEQWSTSLDCSPQLGHGTVTIMAASKSMTLVASQIAQYAGRIAQQDLKKTTSASTGLRSYR
jgi:hypothetical protein